MLYVFSLLILASVVLSVFSVDELAQALAGLSLLGSVALGLGLLVLVWRLRRKQ